MADTEEKKAEEAPKADVPLTPAMTALGIFGILASLYLFLIGLGLMGDAFKCLGGRGAGQMFSGINNPIAGLMVGILATVLVQSSSTSTSIVVGLVSADQFSVRTGIPVIMGANIGTSVTNTIVSMGQMGNRIDLERSFAGATVHDMFNMLTVCTLLPIEIIIAAISGEGGLLYWVSKGLTEALVGQEKSGELFPSPIKAVTKPVTKAILSNNKYVINALSMSEPVAVPLPASNKNATECGERRRLEAHNDEAQFQGYEWVNEDKAMVEQDGSRALLNRRLSDSVDCSQYYCVGSTLDKNYKKMNKKAYKKLTKCGDYVLSDPCSGSDKCYLDSGAFHTKYVTNGDIIKGGMLEGAGNSGGGIIALILSLMMLCVGLFGLVKCLQMLLIKKAKQMIARAVGLNDYIAIVAGFIITIIVQSSSVTTSALTPLCGMGVIPLEKMLPLTLGANIGTTVTALIAALTTMKFGGLQIALVHLLFNITGICIWFPVPFMRKFPLNAARLLGLYASYYRGVPAGYIFFAFVIVPGVLLGISALFDASVAAGVIVTLLLIGMVGAFLFWWIWMGGCYKVLSQEQRTARLQEVEKSNSQMRGEEEEEEAAPKQEASV